jgi:hypothetical protein
MSSYLRVTPFAVMLVLPAPSLAQPSLVEAARIRGGDVTSLVNADFPDADLNRLMADRAVVARGNVVDAKSRLTKDGRNVETEYQFRLSECLRCADEMIGTVVRVVRLGGSVTLSDGTRVATQVQGFPNLDGGADYILFLSPNNGGYNVRFGPHGAFRVRGQKAEQLAKSEWVTARSSGLLDIAELAKLVAETPP